MYLPCTDSRCFQMTMQSAIKQMRHRKVEKDDNYRRANRLHRNYPYLTAVSVRFLMWAILQLGISQVEELAAVNKQPYRFKQAVQKANGGSSTVFGLAT